MYQPEFDPNKMRETVLKVASRPRNQEPCDTDFIGMTMYFADTEAYRQLGQPITGATYHHMPRGPMPTQLPDTIVKMTTTGEAKCYLTAGIASITTHIEPVRAPDLSIFTEDELHIIEDVMQSFHEYNTANLSKYASAEAGYSVTTVYNPIPYKTSRISTEPLSTEDIKLGLHVAAGLA